ncbi:MAG TPA: glycosyltransferase family 4 protein [Nitrososphaerales archaeon]|nr:glycosyltransferase family 4 protein [Nitrososphaerales archaeon]
MTMRVGVIMYETSYSKGQELVAERMVREFNRLGHDAYLITSVYHDWEPVVSDEEVAKRGGYVHTFDERLDIPVLRVGSEIASWPPRRILFRNFVGVLSQIVSDLKLNVLITHSTLWNGPEDATKFVVWNRQMNDKGAYNPPILLCHMSHFQEASDERYTLEERTFRETWNAVSLKDILQQADFVLVTTPIERSQMKELGADESKCILMPGGIDDEAFAEAETPPDPRLPASAKLVTFLGTVEERKNVLSVVDVARRFESGEGVHFAIAGRMDGDYAEKVKAAAEGVGNVTLLGEISDGEKVGLIKKSFANINLSRSEALGIAQLEFMYGGVPVVTSGVGGQSWIVHDEVNGLVVRGPDDIDGAAAAITRLARNPKLRKRLSKGALQTSSQMTLSSLIASLSRRLNSRLYMEGGFSVQPEAREKLIEARVQGGKRVVVTTTRLIVSSAKEGRSIVSVPYGEITRISRSVRRRWSILAVGLGLFCGSMTLALIAPSQFPPVDVLLKLVPSMGASELAALAVRASLLFSPLIVAAPLFFATVKDGYLVQYGQRQKVFLEREFGRLLKIGDSLGGKSLFRPDAEEL